MKESVKSKLRCEALQRSEIKEECVVWKRDTGRTNDIPHKTEFSLEVL